MTEQELFSFLQAEFVKTIQEHNLGQSPILIQARGLKPEEAIGTPSRKDYPILNGKEIMVQADFQGAIGQAFTSYPADFQCTLAEIAKLKLETHEKNYQQNRGLFIAALNALYAYLYKLPNTIHCKDDEPEACALHFSQYLKKEDFASKVLLIGYQPALLERLSLDFLQGQKGYAIRLLDLNPELIGQKKYGVIVESGEKWSEACAWADLIFCTGSTICNGSIVNFLDLPNVLFYGTSIGASAEILKLKRLCPMSL